jgi:outer membrane protein
MHGNLLSARTGARRFQAAIERLIARPVRTEEIPEPAPPLSVPVREPSSANPDALVKQALDRRPEIAAVRSLINAARERVESAKGGLLPKVGASFRYEWDTEDFSRNADSWLVGVKATWPIFEGGVTISRLREAESRLKEMEGRGEQVVLDISLEVKQAALAVEEALEKVTVAGERKKWAETALHEVQHQYRDEAAGVDSLLQAEAAWSQAETGHATALFEVQIARALLQQALGDFAGSMEARYE